jgi:hypothetical protein
MLSEQLSMGNGLVPCAVAPGDRAAWLDVLSEELLNHLPVEAWRKLFLGAGFDHIRFTQETLTLVCCEMPAPEWSEVDLRTLAARFGGSLEQCGAYVVMTFARPRAALEVALLVQRTCTRRLRSALFSAPCVSATFELEGEKRHLTLGEPPRTARANAENSPPGSVHVCASSWRALGPAALDRHTHKALVTTEYQGDEVISATITLPPPPRAAMSTFAGLGLV